MTSNGCSAVLDAAEDAQVRPEVQAPARLSEPRSAIKLSYSVVVPTYRPGPSWKRWLDALAAQTVRPQEAIVVDSSSCDGTVELAARYGLRILQIPKSEFDHGSARMLGVDACGPVDVVLFLTQDAQLARPDSVEKLLAAFADENLAAVYGRQLPVQGASAIGAHARLFSYPEHSLVRDSNAIPDMGIRAARFSNSFGAYRLAALREVGGFPSGVIFGEDQFAVARMVLQGWKIAYQAEAQVYHSHDYSFAQEFRRYFDIGVSHRATPWLLDEFGGAVGEGRRYVRSELSYLWQRAPGQIPSALLRTGLKFLAYNLGKIARILPKELNRSLSMNPNFWNAAAWRI